MFFIDAKGLGKDFFAPQPMGERLRLPLSDTQSAFETIKDPRARQFTAWILSIALPILREADPTRTPNPEDSLLFIKPGYSFGPVHQDSMNPVNRTYITIGVNEDGSSGSTTCPRDPNYYGPPTSKLSRIDLHRNFYIPPPMHATVFDPDLEMHASMPGIDRTLYKVELEPISRNENLRILTAPEHPLVVDPTSLPFTD